MLRVRDWAKYFENNRTRELKSMTWVPFPNSHDGDGYTELLDHPNGAAHFGAWVSIVQVASKCDVRGTLLRDGARPHDARSLARMTRFPLAIMEEAIQRLVEVVGWLEVASDPAPEYGVTATPQESAATPQESAADCRRGAVSSIPFNTPPSSLSSSTEETLRGASARKKGGKKFTPPSVDEVRAYCAERGNGIDAELFVATYKRQNWNLSNGQPMSDWKSAVITWEKNNRKTTPAHAGRDVTMDDLAERAKTLFPSPEDAVA